MMADFLIMAKDKTHTDPDKDARCYKRGDIVEVFEHGKMQTPPVGSPFVLVRVTGITKAQADQYMEEDKEAFITPKLEPDYIMVRRRVYHIDYTLLPLAIINKLRDGRFIEISLLQAKNFIRNKVTGGLG